MEPETHLLAELLTKTYTTSSNTDRQQAEILINQMKINAQTYFNDLLSIITNLLGYTVQTRQSAALGLKVFWRELMLGQCTYSIQHIAQLCSQVFDIIKLPDLEPPVRSQVSLALKVLIENVSSSDEPELIRSLCPIFMASLSGSVNDAVAGLDAMRLMFTTELQVSETTFVQEVFPSLLGLGLKAVIELKNNIVNQQEQAVQQAAGLLSEWTLTLSQIFESLGKQLDFIATNDVLASVLHDIITTILPDTIITESLINIGDNFAHQTLNNAKASAMDCFITLLNHLINQKRKQIGFKSAVVVGVSLPQVEIVSLSQTLLPRLVSTLSSLCSNKDIEGYTGLEYISGPITKAILLVQLLACEPQFHDIFHLQYQSILIEVCIPLLQVTSADKERFTENPTDFVSFCLDTWERYSMVIPSTCAAQLLESVCEYVDGALTFATTLLLQLSEFALSRRNISDFDLLRDMMGATDLLQEDGEGLLAVALLSLSVLSSLLAKREDLRDKIELQLVHYAPQYLGNTSPIIKQRLCLFFYFFSEHLFRDSYLSYQEYFNSILSCLDADTVPAAVVIQAWETLVQVLKDEEQMYRLEPFIEQVIDTMTYVFMDQRENTFFDVFHSIWMQYSEKIDAPTFENILSVWARKIQQELQIIGQYSRNSNNKDTTRITKCWHIIHLLSDSDNLIPRYSSIMENFLQQFLNVDCSYGSNELIESATWVLKKAHSITQFQADIVQNLTIFQDRNNGQLGVLYVFLTNFLDIGQSTLAQLPGVLQIITSSAIRQLGAKWKKGHGEANVVQGALLLHQILISFKGSLGEIVGTILKATYKRFQERIEHSFLKVKLMGIMLASFYNDVHTTCQTLDHLYRGIRVLIVDIFSSMSGFSNHYDRKLVVLGLTELLTADTLPSDLASDIYSLLSALISILSAGSSNEMQVGSVNRDNVENEAVYLAESFFQSQVGADSRHREENDAILATNQLRGPLQAFDEYNYFRQIMTSIKTNNTEAFTTLISSVPAPERQVLIELLQTRRVPISQTEARITVERKIVKARHMI